MPRFFTDKVDGDEVIIIGDDANHISKSLRMKLGDEITLSSQGIDYNCTISQINISEVICKIISSQKCLAEPTVEVTLYQAMPKLDKFEFIVQKATELGVTRIVPILSSRCISRPDNKTFAKKMERYNKIALEAAKQSGRGIVPIIEGIINFDDTLERMKSDDLSLILYEKGGKSLSNFEWSENMSISVLIGSEGGFSEQEVAKAISSSVHPIWLGNRILRCETAPITALSIIMHLTKNL